MRFAPVLGLLAACASAPEPVDLAAAHLRAAEEAAVRPDWPTVRRELERAAVAAPDDPVVLERLAETRLVAFGEVEAAERLYLRLRAHSRARAVHGLGRCALWRGEEERALALFQRSLEIHPTAACARDLAARLLGRGEPADEALDVVEEISAASFRSRLLLAAAGRRPRPTRLPEGWSYGLERARLGVDGALEAYIAAAGAHPRARDRLRRVLAGDLAATRNPAAVAGVSRAGK